MGRACKVGIFHINKSGTTEVYAFVSWQQCQGTIFLFPPPGKQKQRRDYYENFFFHLGLS